MIEFKIVKKSKKSSARLGLLKTKHGVIETPCLVPVATQAAVKTLTSEEAKETKSQILICNTYHLHLKPGEEIIEKAGGLHRFMNWSKPLMTDSGGFQVFSLGFGRDFGTGKILKEKREDEIGYGQQPKLLKITQDGVYFRSFLDGKKVFLGPRESVKIQEKLGADIIFAFDECTSPIADYGYTRKSLEKTNKWAKICLDAKKSRQALFGIVQGGKFRDLRIESARFIGGLDFDGFGIGGEFGDNKKKMLEMLNWTMKELPEEKPRHLLGIGYLEDIPKIIERGVDLFDCNVPTHYARRGIAFTSEGKLDLSKEIFLRDGKTLDRKCSCFVCKTYGRRYISHLFRAKEITALSLLTFHNLYFFNSFVEKMREKIKQGKL
ncbi:MAG: tRNA guanosine(34) transglycosylase Tgt [Candidatus Pacebacteria bacterium]|nr:tRNA guanosine(34) transglycosylase Tgt [Candidatus Paceibacterota bacterium]